MACVADSEARIWDVDDLDRVVAPRLAPHIGTIGGEAAAGATISADGSTVALPSARGAIRIYRGGALAAKLPGRARPLYALQLSADGDRVLSVSNDGAMQLRTVDGRSIRLAASLPRVDIRNVAKPVLDPTGRRVVVLAPSEGRPLERRMETWDLATGRRNIVELDGASERELRFDPGGNVVLVISGSVEVIDVVSGVRVTSLPALGNSSILSADFAGRRVVTTTSGPTLAIWNPGATILAGDPGRSPGAVFSPDGKRVAATDGAVLRTWNTSSGTLGGPGRLRLAGSTGAFVASFSASGARLRAARGFDQVIHDVDWRSGRDDASRPGGRPLAIAQSGAIVVGNPASNAFEVRALRSDKVRLSIPGPKEVDADNAIGGWVFSRDGGRLALLEGRTAVVRDIMRRRRILPPGTRGLRVTAIALRPDGREVATVDGSGSVHVSDVDTDRRRTVTQTRSLEVASLATLDYSPDGRLLVLAETTTIRVLDISSRREVATFEGEALAVDPASSRVAITGTATRAHLRRCDECGSWEQLLARADRRVRRGLTEAERRSLLSP